MASPAEDLCLSCGLCCDGSVFDAVSMHDDDAPVLDGLLGVETRVAPGAPAGQGGVRFFRQACAQLGADGACGCYAVRPVMCRRFTCKLQRRLEAGVVSREDAHEIVRDMKSLRARALDVMARLLGLPADQAARSGVVALRKRVLGQMQSPAGAEFVYRCNRALALCSAFETQISLHVRTVAPRAKPADPGWPDRPAQSGAAPHPR